MTEPLAYALNGIYLVVWAFLLAHCLRKPRFFPIFGPGLGTRLFWLVTFVFFNPILTFFYLLFGVFAPANARRTALRTFGPAMLVALTAIVFHFPFPAPSDGVRVVGAGAGKESDASSDRPAIWFRVGRLITATRTQTTLGQWSPEGAALAARNIALFTTSDDMLLDRLAAATQDRLAEAPGVESVAYYRPGQRPEPGRSLPDVVITLALSEMKETVLPLSHLLSARVRWLASAGDIHPGRGFAGGRHTSPCTVQFRLEGELEVKECLDLALHTASARYGGAAAQLGSELAQSIAASLESMAAAHGRAPALPGTVIEPFRAPPDPTALGLADAEVLLSGPMPLQHNRTVWRVRDRREPKPALAAIRTMLEAEGWQARSTCTEDSLHLRRGRRELRVHRPKYLDAIIARYDEHFDDDAVTRALDEVLASDTSLSGLMMFRSRYSAAQKERLRIRLGIEGARDAVGWFRLARAWDAIGDPKKAAHALKAAVVYGQCSDMQADAGKVNALAKKLGDPDIPRIRPTVEICESVGFIPIQENAATVEREVGFDEPIYYARTRNGVGFFTLMAKIRRKDDGSPMFRYKVHEQLATAAWGGQTTTTHPNDRPHHLDVGDGRITLRTEEAANGRYTVKVRLEAAPAQ